MLRQDFEDLELIIVGDASTDSSVEIIQRYKAADPRISVLLHDHNLGIARMLNDGTDLACGEFLGATASDDVWMKDKLSKQLEVLGSNEDLIIWSDGEILDQDGGPTGERFSDTQVSRKRSGYIFHELLGNNYVFGSSLLYKRRNVEGIRFDPSLVWVNYYKFELELARKYEFYYISEPLAQHRIHGGNTLTGAGPDQVKRRRTGYSETIQMCQEFLRRYDEELPRAAKATIYHVMGNKHRELGEYKEGLRVELQAIRDDPRVIFPFF